MTIVSSEFCDVDGEHTGPAVMKNVNEREVFLCDGCWKKRFPEEKFPLANTGE